MLDLQSSESLYRLSDPAYRLFEEDSIPLLLIEIAGTEIRLPERAKTNAGHFAMKLKEKYDEQAFLIKECITDRGSIALMYWGYYGKFTIIKSKTSKGTYILHNLDINISDISTALEEFESFR